MSHYDGPIFRRRPPEELAAERKKAEADQADHAIEATTLAANASQAAPAAPASTPKADEAWRAAAQARVFEPVPPAGGSRPVDYDQLIADLQPTDGDWILFAKAPQAATGAVEHDEQASTSPVTPATKRAPERRDHIRDPLPLTNAQQTAAGYRESARDRLRATQLASEPLALSGSGEVGSRPSRAERRHPQDQSTFTPTKHARRPVATTSGQQANGYQFPPLSLLASPVHEPDHQQHEWVQTQTQRLDETLAAFHVAGHVVAHTVGPTVTQFQVALDVGVKVNRVINLTDDLKMALAAKDIRIEAPIPGKSTVGIEIPNLHARPVMLREVLGSPAFTTAPAPLTIALGVNLFGQPVVTDLAKMPHGLIAGATGSGKSVFINSLLTSLLYRATPQQVRLLLIDPKAVELAVYNDLPHLVAPVISDPQTASAALQWAVNEMEERYQKMAAAGVRNLEQFNRQARAHGDDGLVLPYLVIIIDELADLMMAAASDVQTSIARITAKARAAGIHLIVATQRPSVDVVTGTIKNNIPARIAFMVASQVDSRTIIDQNGAERLLGRGDMLYLGSGASQPMRLQGTFVDREIDEVVAFVKTQGAPHYDFDPAGLMQQEAVGADEDELMPQVLAYLNDEKQISTSKLQRVFSIGYNRAANLIDTLEGMHYVSSAHGAKPRDVYYHEDDTENDED